MPDLAAFLSHRSVRTYTPEALDRETRSALIATAQSASTSSNLHLWSVVDVADPDLRAKVNEHCSQQAQVVSAPWFLVFCADHHRLRSLAKERGESADALAYMDYFLMGVVDASLAAERLAVAAETLGYGVCYIGAIRNNPEAVAQLLHLPQHCFPVFGLCVGRPDPDHPTSVKPRPSQETMWFENRYPDAAEWGNYDERMAEFYASQGQNPDVSWTDRSLRRLEPRYMSGRDGNLPWLQNRDLGSK